MTNSLVAMSTLSLETMRSSSPARPSRREGREREEPNERNSALPCRLGLNVPPTAVGVLDVLALLFWLGRLIQIRYARDLRNRERLHLELLAQESQAVAARFGVQSVWRVVELQAFWLAYY